MHVFITYGVSITVLCLGYMFHDGPWKNSFNTESKETLVETPGGKNGSEMMCRNKTVTLIKECNDLGNNAGTYNSLYVSKLLIGKVLMY